MQRIRCGGCEERGRQGTGHVHCDGCGNLLGIDVAGFVLVRHKGREILAVPLSIVCERCRTTWRPPEDRRAPIVRAVPDEPLSRVS